jgi:hypothetical protein
MQSRPNYWRIKAEIIASSYLRIYPAGFEFKVKDIITYAERQELHENMDEAEITKYLIQNKIAKKHIKQNLMIKL